MRNYLIWRSLLAIVLAAALSACGSGGSSSSPPATLNGVAAAGAALAGATFKVTSLASRLTIATGTVDNAGAYQTSLTVDNAPYLIAVTDTGVTPAQTYQAILLASDLGATMNVTPITDMVANIALNDPAVLAALASVAGSATSATSAPLTAALTSARNGAVAAVQTALAPVLNLYGVSDTGTALLTHVFTPSIDAMDKVLDTFTSSCGSGACTISLKSIIATSALGGTALVIPTISVSAATTAATTLAATLGNTSVLTAMHKAGPVVVVVRAINAWGTGTGALAHYTGTITIYNFSDKDYSASSNKPLYFESNLLDVDAFYLVTPSVADGKFLLTLPASAALPAASAGGASAPYVINFTGSGILAAALDLTNCNIGGDKCILMIDDGTLGTVTAATGGWVDTPAAAIRSWSNFITNMTPVVQANSNTTPLTLAAPVVQVAATPAAAPSLKGYGAVVAMTTADAISGNIQLTNTSGVRWDQWQVTMDLPASASGITLQTWAMFNIRYYTGTTFIFQSIPIIPNTTINSIIPDGYTRSLPFVMGFGTIATTPSNCKLTYVSAGTSVTSTCVITFVGSTAGTATTSVTTPTPTPGTTSPVNREIGTYFAQWGVYGRNFEVADLHTTKTMVAGVATSMADQLTFINYAFANIYSQNGGYECGMVSKTEVGNTDPTSPAAGSGGDAWSDYQRPPTRTIDGNTYPFTAPLSGNFMQLKLLKAAHPKLRVFISLGGWTWSKYFSAASQTDALRKQLVASCVKQFIAGDLPVDTVSGHGGVGAAKGVFDGIDIDWETPGGGGGETYNIVDTVNDKHNFTLLLAEFRTQLDARGVLDGKTYALTAAVLPGIDRTAQTEPALYIKSLDWINLMAYDFHGAWYNQTNFNASLYHDTLDPSTGVTAKYNIDDSITALVAAGVPANKIVLGIPLYGRGWQGVSAGPNGYGLYQAGSNPASYAAPGVWDTGINDYKVLKNVAGARTMHSISEEIILLTPTGEWWNYDDPSTVAVKMQYVNKIGLRGAFSWEIDGDDKGELTNAIWTGR